MFRHQNYRVWLLLVYRNLQFSLMLYSTFKKSQLHLRTGVSMSCDSRGGPHSPQGQSEHMPGRSSKKGPD